MLAFGADDPGSNPGRATNFKIDDFCPNSLNMRRSRPSKCPGALREPRDREVPIPTAGRPRRVRGSRAAHGDPERQLLCESLGTTGQAECDVVRGPLEGTARVVFKKDYQCQEVKCLSKGDALCEFLLRLRAQA